MPKIPGLPFYSREQLLRYLVPHYAIARRDLQEDLFFEKLFALYFNRFPVDARDLQDPDEISRAIDSQKQVCRIISITAYLIRNPSQ